MTRKLSVITPCFNEDENLLTCYLETKQVISNLETSMEYEHIFIDNASTDRSMEILREIAREDQNVKVIRNSRNVGPFRSMWFGLKHSSGDAIIPMLPADLQDPATKIPQLLENWRLGYLVVYGIRQNRQESLVMRMARTMYYKSISKLAKENIPINAGEFMLIDRKILNSILSVDDQYPYIRGLVAQTGVEAAYVRYTWEARKFGKSKNSILDLLDQGLNGFVSTGKSLVRLTLLSGLFLAIFGFLGAAVTAISTLIDPERYQVGVPTLVISILFFSGVQLIFLGMIGEYVVSIHSQVRRTPPVFALEQLNFSSLTDDKDLGAAN